MLNSIRSRLKISFLGLAIVPILIVGFILILRTFTVQTLSAIQLQSEMVSHISSRFKSLINNLEKNMQILIRIEDLINMRPDQQKLILSIFQSQNYAIDEIILLDSSGNVLNYYSRLKSYHDLLLQSPQYLDSFKIPVKQKATYFGPVRFHEVSGEPYMSLAIPIIALDTGETKGVLATTIRLKEVWDLVSQIRPGAGGISFIIDKKNRVIAHSDPSVVLRGASFKFSGHNGIQIGISGQQSVLVGKKINFGTQHFHIIVEGPVLETLALAFNSIYVILAIMTIASLVGIKLGLFTVNRIVEPIEGIVDTARAINSGDLLRRVAVEGYDEICILANAFNKMADELNSLINNLEKRVEIRTAELTVSNQELESFAYSISHDLRAPLRHIDGFLELLKRHTGTSLDEQSLNYMDKISSSVRKMEQLIEDLLLFSRVKQHNMQITHIDLNDMVSGIINELELESSKRNIKWRVGDLPLVRGDFLMINTVMMNLILNAIKFSGKQNQVQIEIGYQATEKENIIFVRDNGVGFDKTYSDKLFQVFQRLHHEKDFEGTGVGLAIVKRIINRHKGSIWAESEVGKGATFYISLPIINGS